MNAVSPELKSFIEAFCKRNKIKIHIPIIAVSTSVDLDLNIFDITVDLFLTEFIQKFEINYSKFDWKNHGGYPKDSMFIGSIRFLFGYKITYLKKLILRFYKPKLFVSDLQLAVQTKELI